MNAVVSVATFNWREALLINRDKTLEKLYARTYPMVLHYVRQRGGTSDDAKDILQDAIILFYEKTVLDELTLTSTASTYIMGICKNLWRRQQEKKHSYQELTTEALETRWEEPETDAPAPARQLMDYVEQLGERCKQLLVNFYYFGQRMEQIAAGQGYRNVHTASVQKFKCLERLRKTVSHLTIRHFN
jgi:RNA polymerase sigma factor (sigma-70 family)